MGQYVDRHITQKSTLDCKKHMQAGTRLTICMAYVDGMELIDASMKLRNEGTPIAGTHDRDHKVLTMFKVMTAKRWHLLIHICTYKILYIRIQIHSSPDIIILYGHHQQIQTVTRIQWTLQYLLYVRTASQLTKEFLKNPADVQY